MDDFAFFGHKQGLRQRPKARNFQTWRKKGKVIIMMKWIWSAMLALSVVIGISTGRIGAVSQAAITGASDAVALFIILLGTICLWNGLMKIA